MNQAVWKFPLRFVDEQDVKMPKRSMVLSAKMQDGELMVWALVDTDEQETVDRKFWIHGTGHRIWEPEKVAFIDTVVIENRGLVFHVFEDINQALAVYGDFETLQGEQG